MVLSKKKNTKVFFCKKKKSAFLSTLDSFRIFITLPLLIISPSFLLMIYGVEDDWRKSCN